jgi:hypothetical protein
MYRIGSIEDSIVSAVKFLISFGVLPVKLHPCKLILVKEVVVLLLVYTGLWDRKPGNIRMMSCFRLDFN